MAEDPARPEPSASARSSAEELRRLLLGTAQGSKESFGALYDLAAPQVFAVMTAVAGDRQKAAALTDAAFRQVWASAPRYRAEHDDPMRWVLRVSCLVARDRARALPQRPTRGDNRADTALDPGTVAIDVREREDHGARTPGTVGNRDARPGAR